MRQSLFVRMGVDTVERPAWDRSRCCWRLALDTLRRIVARWVDGRVGVGIRARTAWGGGRAIDMLLASRTKLPKTARRLPTESSGLRSPANTAQMPRLTPRSSRKRPLCR
eukprot:contig_101_g2